jgi:hypothetical protein
MRGEGVGVRSRIKVFILHCSLTHSKEGYSLKLWFLYSVVLPFLDEFSFVWISHTKEVRLIAYELCLGSKLGILGS